MKADSVSYEMGYIRWKGKCKHVLVFTTVLAVTFLIWNLYRISPVPMKAHASSKYYSVWPVFSPYPQHNQAWFRAKCLGYTRAVTIESLTDDIDSWITSSDDTCRRLYQKFSSIYTVLKQPAPVRYPGLFKMKVLRWLGQDQNLLSQALHQNVVHVINKLTMEHTVFNPIREKRPMSKPLEPEREYVERLSKESSKSCDFCNYKQNTAEDVFGRLESALSFTASNAFKLGTWHGLFLPKSHHPLNWTRTEFMDVMAVGLMWFDRAHQEDQRAQYPTIVWDMMPHAGASQIHPHLHGLLDSFQYQGAVENWRQAAETYYKLHGTNYFSDLVELASVLGLLVRHGKAVAFANMVPRKEFEIVIMSEAVNSDFLELFYFTIRGFIDDLEKFSFSLGIGLPSLEDPKGRIPAYARIVSRGAVADVRTDMSSLELFATTNVNADPFRVIKFVKESVKKRHSQSPSAK